MLSYLYQTKENEYKNSSMQIRFIKTIYMVQSDTLKILKLTKRFKNKCNYDN